MRVPVVRGSGSLDADMIDESDESNRTESEPDPLARCVGSISAEKASSQHYPIGYNSSKERRAREAGEEGQACENQGSGKEPIDIAQPKDLADDSIFSVRNVLVLVVICIVFPVHALSSSKSKIDDK